ncbi:hypothetical protein Pyn_18993 [Prunus yedoensis var. nudiflora]|uniref:Uncharacterized protein n=1 Tax=Prunus yedoensis var. nudiflora TaxID=2094558 RepID=A0A314UE16_PRUYE|nr:hypothetical protein Pyn_18993 [Prunus yedoensis var. nudiflora]
MGAWDVGNLELVFGFGDDAWDVDATSPPLSLCSMNAILSVIQRPLSLRFSHSRHLSQSPPSLSVAATSLSRRHHRFSTAVRSHLFILFTSLSLCQLKIGFTISQ